MRVEMGHRDFPNRVGHGHVCSAIILQDYTGSWALLVIQGRRGRMAPREQQGALSKILVNQRRTE